MYFVPEDDIAHKAAEITYLAKSHIASRGTAKSKFTHQVAVLVA